MISQAPKKTVEIQVKNIPDLIRALMVSPPGPGYKTQKPREFHQDDFTQAFLNPEEMDRINGFKALKKQIEWLCGRFAVKTLAKEILLPRHSLDRIRIGYMDQGAPFLEEFPDHCLSLSHSGIYTAAALVPAPGLLTGIDIEAMDPVPDQAFMKTAFTAREIQEINGSGPEVFRCWTLKEAYLKYIRLGFNESLHQVEVIQNKIFHKGREQSLSCWSSQLDQGYILSAVSDPGIQIQVKKD